MKFVLAPMDAASAQAICEWRYPSPYSVYDGSRRHLQTLLDPQNSYHAVFDEREDLAGFFCFGPDAQVPGELVEESDRDPGILDVGLGLRPDLTGRGLGLDFVRAGLAFAREVYSPVAFRMATLTFNHRAIRVYEKVGFRPLRIFSSESEAGQREFLVMVRRV